MSFPPVSYTHLIFHEACVEYIGISQKDISCFHVVGTLVYFIENLSIQDKGDFYLSLIHILELAQMVKERSMDVAVVLLSGFYSCNCVPDNP